MMEGRKAWVSTGAVSVGMNLGSPGLESEKGLMKEATQVG